MMLYRILLIVLIPLCSIQAQDWEVVGSMPRPVGDGEIIVRNGLIHILGGFQDSLNFLTPTDDIQTYDPVQNTWLPTVEMKAPRGGFVSGEWNGQLVYAGGVGIGTTIPPNIFSIERWNYLDPPIIYNFNPECNRFLTSGVISGEYMYMVGGISLDLTDSLEVAYITEYHLPSASVTYRLDTLYSETLLPYDQSVELVGNDLYIIGGSWFTTRPEVHRFNTLTHEYEQVYTLPRERAGAGSSVINGDNIYLIGGYSETEAALDSVNIFQANPNGYRYSSCAPLNFGRINPMSVVVGNYIYVFGGFGEYGQVVPEIERYAAITSIDPFDKENLTSGFDLMKNYPNPFNGQTIIPFELKQAMPVKLEVFSTTGERITTLVDGTLAAGMHEVIWDSRNENGLTVGSGIYFYKLQSNQQVMYEKMILVK